MSEQPAPAETARQQLDPATADAVRAYAARTRATADQFVGVLEDIVTNGLPDPEPVHPVGGTVRAAPRPPRPPAPAPTRLLARMILPGPCAAACGVLRTLGAEPIKGFRSAQSGVQRFERVAKCSARGDGFTVYSRAGKTVGGSGQRMGRCDPGR